LQYCFIFAAIWGLGQTLTQDSREKFDAFYRTLLTGNNKEYPKPKGFKLNKNQLFPEKGLVFDYICDKRNNQWVFWIDILDREHLKISPTAKVIHKNSAPAKVTCIKKPSSYIILCQRF